VFYPEKICPLCDRPLDDSELVDAFVDPAEAYLAARDGDPMTLANCSFCDGFHSIIPCGDCTATVPAGDVREALPLRRLLREPLGVSDMG
jgi:hypothetical protein